MTCMPKAALLLAATLSLSGCADSVPPLPPAVTELGPPVGVKDLLVIGNSITWHSPNAGLAWSGDWGMAATSMERDFAHATATSLRLPLTRFNLADLERDVAAPGVIQQDTAAVTDTTAVVVELSDNVGPAAGDLQTFQPDYHALLDAVSKAKSLTCTST